MQTTSDLVMTVARAGRSAAEPDLSATNLAPVRFVADRSGSAAEQPALATVMEEFASKFTALYH